MVAHITYLGAGVLRKCSQWLDDQPRHQLVRACPKQSQGHGTGDCCAVCLSPEVLVSGLEDQRHALCLQAAGHEGLGSISTAFGSETCSWDVVASCAPISQTH